MNKKMAFDSLSYIIQGVPNPFVFGTSCIFEPPRKEWHWTKKMTDDAKIENKAISMLNDNMNSIMMLSIMMMIPSFHRRSQEWRIPPGPFNFECVCDKREFWCCMQQSEEDKREEKRVKDQWLVICLDTIFF